MKISYTPEKIDEFIEQITKDIASAKNIFTTALNKTKEMSLNNIIEDPSSAEDFLEKLKEINEAINKKHTKYFDIVELYDFMDSPKNVKQLEYLVDELDHYYYDISKIETVLEEIIYAASKLTDFYNKENL